MDKNNLLAKPQGPYRIRIMILVPLVIFLIIKISLADDLDDKSKIWKDVEKYPARRLSYYEFSEKKPFLDRLNWKSREVLRYLRDYDDRPDYTIYEPSPHEKKLISRFFKRLPVAYKMAIQKHLTGFYFINNFWGNGLTEWVVDNNNHIYAFVAFNSQTLKQSISEMLSERANSCFRKDFDYRIRVHYLPNAKKDDTNLSIYYMFAHEFSHLIDYSYNLSPFVDNGSKFIKNNSISTNKFTRGVWQSYSKLLPRHDFPEHAKLSFYGFKKGPLLNFNQANAILEKLKNSPLVSLYGMQNWAEDIAEIASCYILCFLNKEKLQIELLHKEKVIQSYSPGQNNEVRKRMLWFHQQLKTIEEGNSAHP